MAEFQAGVDILGKIAPVYLGLDAKVKDNIFAGVKCKEINSFDGPHPAGNAGVQISHIIPVNKGENVIVVNPQDVAIIGRLVKNGIYDAKKTVVIAGSKVNKPQYIKTIANTSVAPLIGGNIDADNARIISGNVLTGTKIDEKGFLGFYDNAITVIPEGNYYDFFGWALPGFKKFSVSRTFFSWLTPKKQYDLDTNMHGEERAYVVTGTYEKLLPVGNST